MADATTQTPALVEFKVGDLVKTGDGQHLALKDQYGYSQGSLHKDRVYRITRVNKNTVQVRLADGQTKPESQAGHSFYDSLTSVPKSAIRISTDKIKTYVENFIEDGEDIIAVDDPRIDYIWRAAAKAADEQGYCSVYDEITKKVGIPGRPKNFTVTVQVGALEARVTISARTKEEAQKKAQAQLDAGGTTVTLKGSEEG